jgi:DMSO/TMAO reductase YedYZ molybdopterin-dependent catalytic subunit
MSKTPDNTTNPAVETSLRRRVLKRLGLGSAAVAVAVATQSLPAAAMKPPAGKAGPTYKESAHVKQFYQVNRY